jgi:hypothetical protein
MHTTMRIPGLLAIEDTNGGAVIEYQSVWGIFDPAVKAVFVGGYAAAAQLQLQPQPANRDDGKRHKLDKKTTEGDEEFGRGG